MKAMIFAAGLGTRLKPLTDRMPKALVPVNGQPLLAIQLMKLKQSGFTEVVVNVHHFADMIEEYLNTHDFGLRVSVSDERRELLDTGGGLLHAKDLLGEDAPILIHNVDILSNASLPDFVRHGADADAVLLVSERKTQRYLLFDDTMRLMGWTNIATGEVKSPYPDLNPADYHQYAFSGIHLFSGGLFEKMEGWPVKFPIMDFYLKNCAVCRIKGAVQPGLQLLDVGKQDTLVAADAFQRAL